MINRGLISGVAEDITLCSDNARACARYRYADNIEVSR